MFSRKKSRFSHKIRYNTACTVWKNEKFSLTKNISSKDSLVIFLVKGLLSQNFCQNCVRLSQQFLHCGLGRKNYEKVKCFHEKIQIFRQNMMVFTAKCFHVIFWLYDLIYKIILVQEYDKMRPTKLILEIMKNAAQVKCGLGRFLK